jgi:chromosome partitioning protein
LRNIKFLIEVKSAKVALDDSARFQLGLYLRYSKTRFGILINPSRMEIHECVAGQVRLKEEYVIENPCEIEAAAQFLDLFLEKICMRIIAIHSSKGGVGKTTLVFNLAYELAQQGKRILVVDLDEQANASLVLGVNKANEIDRASTPEKVEHILESLEERKQLIDFLKNSVEDDFNYSDYVYTSPFNTDLARSGGKIDVLPSSYKTEPAQIENRPQSDLLLKSGLRNVVGDYDYVLIDTPPTYHRITANGFLAAQYVIIPSQMEYLSLYGIRRPVKYLKRLQRTSGEQKEVVGIVPMMTVNTKLNDKINSLVKNNFKPIRILPEIKRSTIIGQAMHQRLPLSLFAETNRQAYSSAQQFVELTQAVVEHIEFLESKK